MRRLGRWSLFFCLLPLRAQETSPAPDSAPVLRLDEAIAIAERDNRQVQISSLDVAKASDATGEAKSLRFPQLKTYVLGGQSLSPINFTVPMGALGVYPNIGAVPSHDADIETPRRPTATVYASAQQPISQLHRIGLNIRESKVAEELAGEKVRQQKQDVAQQVRQAYYQVAQIQGQLASVEAGLKYLKELDALTDRNLAQQTVLKADSLGVKAKLSQQNYQLLTLQDAFDAQKEALNHLLGRDLRMPFSVEVQPLPPLEETDLKAAQQKALAQRPEVRQAGLQSKKAELDVRLERAEYLPDFSLQLSYLSFPNISFAPQNIVSGGFLFEWQPFDWGQKKHHLAELRDNSKQASLTTQDAEQQVLLDVNSNFRKLREARALLDADAAAQEAEHERLRVVMNRYQQKTALLADALQEQAASAQADNQYQQALAGFWTARANFAHSLGEE